MAVSLFTILVFLHITGMFAAVAISYGPTALFLIALRGGRTEQVRAVTVAGRPLVKLIPPMYGIAGILGLFAAIVAGFNLLAPWLVIAYVLFVVLTIIGSVWTGPTIERVGKVAATAPDGPLAADTRTALGRNFYVVEFFDFALLAVFIFDMVIKPFS